MFYFLEIVLYRWLMVDVLGEPWLFWAAIAIGIALYFFGEVTRNV